MSSITRLHHKTAPHHSPGSNIDSAFIHTQVLFFICTHQYCEWLLPSFNQCIQLFKCRHLKCFLNWITLFEQNSSCQEVLTGVCDSHHVVIIISSFGSKLLLLEQCGKLDRAIPKMVHDKGKSPQVHQKYQSCWVYHFSIVSGSYEEWLVFVQSSHHSI